MGRQIDFVDWFGFPEIIICPKCNKKTETDFCDYDMDCDHDDKTLYVICNHCEHEIICEIGITNIK